MIWVVLFLALTPVAVALANLRWWRVAQREHYLPVSMWTFPIRWWTSSPLNIALAVVGLTALLVGLFFPPALLLTPLVVAVGPIGLSLRGRTAKLVWTARMKKVAVLTVALQVALPALSFYAPLGPLLLGGLLIAPDYFVGLALIILAPYEKRKAGEFVTKAKARLAQIHPTVIGITGSYGKTSTKGYVAHLIQGTKSVFATPASFNNRAGLSRSINEQLSIGTQVFVAEMGTYGPGEIRELCEFVSPKIAMITAIGPVHLERFKTEDAIVAAKAEIFENAETCILNVDDERLAALATTLEQRGKVVQRCGSVASGGVDVRVEADGTTVTVTIDGEVREDIHDTGAPATNVACAIAAAIAVGVSVEDLVQRLGSLPVAEHRQAVATNANGVTVIDDTFNANPASLARGLRLLVSSAGDEARRVVVTPGMVELGPRQSAENADFAKKAAVVATDLITIGRTNRSALLQGAKGSGLNVVVFDRLPQAVEWVREHTADGDAVLYANDLPDHFP